jgi:hypothetical protein
VEPVDEPVAEVAAAAAMEGSRALNPAASSSMDDVSVYSLVASQVGLIVTELTRNTGDLTAE